MALLNPWPSSVSITMFQNLFCKKKAFFFAWPTPKHSMAVLTSFGNPLILAFAKIIFFSGKICQAPSSTHTMWLNDFLGSINTLLYIWLKLWKFELSFSVFTFLRTVLLSFWVTVRQLNWSFAGRNSVFNLTKTHLITWDYPQ